MNMSKFFLYLSLNKLSYSILEFMTFKKVDYKQLEMRKRFNLKTSRINSLDISSCGNYMVTSDDDDKLTVFDILAGCEIKVVLSKKYGCDHIVFTKGDFNALHTSTKINHVIRYLSLENKAYIRYFNDHKDTVLSLSINPNGKEFLSSSKDGTIKLWDIRCHSCCGTNYNHKNPRVTYDPYGTVFGVADDNNTVKLFDSRALDCPPFSTIEIKSSRNKINDIKFSPDGRLLYVGMNSSYFYTLNAFTGEKKCAFDGVNNPDRKRFGADFSPCCRYIVAGNNNGELNYYDTSNGKLVKTFKSTHKGMVEKVVFHPSYLMLVTADSDLIWWTPDPKDVDEYLEEYHKSKKIR
uniref:WD_REPEATS_REGION domain-containing protein n=1 Tax=Parastrongyloides trichosuri TaxID=131310 RepID=A0A0N4ZJT2_PARTI